MRRTAIRRQPRRKTASWAAEDLPRKMWLEGMERTCLMRDVSVCEGQIAGHHAITRQDCRKHGLEEWSHQNRFGLCYRHHRRHHSRHEPIPRSLLPGSVIEFAWKGDLLWLLERVYPS